MKFEQTQKGKLLEQIKLAKLVDTPIVYIPTPQLELIEEILYSQECENSIIPRLWCDGRDGDKIKELSNRKTSPFDNPGSVFTSCIDNYVVDTFSSSDKYPNLFVLFETNWDDKAKDLVKYVKQFIGIKHGNNYVNPKKIELTRKSLCIVVMPSYSTIPEQLAPYVKTAYVEPISDEEIECIISETMKEMLLDPQIITEKEKLFTLMKVSFRGMSSLRTRQLMLQMIRSGLIDENSILESEIINAIHEAKKEILGNCPGLRWEKVGSVHAAGLENVTSWLNEHAELFHDPHKALERHIDIPNGILITGIPGSGKSLMAKTAARLLDMPLISLNMGLLRGGIVGESEHNLEIALNTAESMAPCVLWIDEIEKAMSGSSANGGGDSGVGARMFGTFLTWMQEKSSACFVFATSNDISHLPPELFRSERFDKKFFTFMPMARECAEIFSSIIIGQNRQYETELAKYDKKKYKTMPQRLFEEKLEDVSTWLEILNNSCSTNPEDCHLRKGKDGRLLWNSGRKPTNKLLSGADISSIIKEAKFRAYLTKEKNNSNSIFGLSLFKEKVTEVIKGFKPYGETNLPNLAKSFLSLLQNQFEPASGSFILNFGDFDEMELRYSPNQHGDASTFPLFKETYDEILYHTLVGAINHYLPILDKKGQLS